MKGGRLAADDSSRHAMAFQAELVFLTPVEHSCMNGAVRLVAALTAVGPYGQMLEYEGAPLFAVAIEAGVLPFRIWNRAKAVLLMSVVAIDASHGALQHGMMERLSEFGRRQPVAIRAQEVGLLFQKSRLGESFRVDAVATDAGEVGSAVSRLRKGPQMHGFGMTGQAIADHLPVCSGCRLQGLCAS